MRWLVLCVLCSKLLCNCFRTRIQQVVKVGSYCPTDLDYNEIFEPPVCQWTGSIQFPQPLPAEVFDNIFGSFDDAEEEAVSQIGKYVVTQPIEFCNNQSADGRQLSQGDVIDVDNFVPVSKGLWHVWFDGFKLCVISRHQDGAPNLLKLGNAPLAWDYQNGIFQITRAFMSELAKATHNVEFQHGMALAAHADHTHCRNITTVEGLKKAVAKVARKWADCGVPASLAQRALMPTSIVALVKACWWGAAATTSWIPVVGWGITALLTAVQTVALTFHYKWQDEAARTTLETLVARVQCVRSKISLSPGPAKIQQEQNNFFTEPLTEVCTPLQQMQLLMVMQRANFAFDKLLEAVEEYGVCLYPSPFSPYAEDNEETRTEWSKRRTRKIACFAAVHETLVDVSGKPGLLTMTLSFLAAYGAMSDEIMKTPLYSIWMKMILDVKPAALHSLQEIKQLVLSKSDVGTPEQEIHVSTCTIVVAMHRAYEMTLKRLKVAWKIHTQSYFRDTWYLTARNHPYPCKAFYSMEKGGRQEGFCKRTDLFTNSEGKHVTGGPGAWTWSSDWRKAINMTDIAEVCNFAKRGWEKELEEATKALEEPELEATKAVVELELEEAKAVVEPQHVGHPTSSSELNSSMWDI